MEEQRNSISKPMNMNAQNIAKATEMAITRDFTTVGTLELRVPRTRDGKFSPSVFERYQRNESSISRDVKNVRLWRLYTQKSLKSLKNYVASRSLSPLFQV